MGNIYISPIQITRATASVDVSSASKIASPGFNKLDVDNLMLKLEIAKRAIWFAGKLVLTNEIKQKMEPFINEALHEYPEQLDRYYYYLDNYLAKLKGVGNHDVLEEKLFTEFKELTDLIVDSFKKVTITDKTDNGEYYWSMQDALKVSVLQFIANSEELSRLAFSIDESLPSCLGMIEFLYEKKPHLLIAVLETYISHERDNQITKDIVRKFFLNLKYQQRLQDLGYDFQRQCELQKELFDDTPRLFDVYGGIGRIIDYAKNGKNGCLQFISSQDVLFSRLRDERFFYSLLEDAGLLANEIKCVFLGVGTPVLGTALEYDAGLPRCEEPEGVVDVGLKQEHIILGGIMLTLLFVYYLGCMLVDYINRKQEEALIVEQKDPLTQVRERIKEGSKKNQKIFSQKARIQLDIESLRKRLSDFRDLSPPAVSRQTSRYTPQTSNDSLPPEDLPKEFRRLRRKENKIFKQNKLLEQDVKTLRCLLETYKTYDEEDSEELNEFQEKLGLKFIEQANSLVWE